MVDVNSQFIVLVLFYINFQWSGICFLFFLLKLYYVLKIKLFIYFYMNEWIFILKIYSKFL